MLDIESVMNENAQSAQEGTRPIDEWRCDSVLTTRTPLAHAQAGPNRHLPSDGQGRMIRLRVLGAIELHDGDGREPRAILAQPRRLALLVSLSSL